ncbi:MAG: sodium:calcium antiporter [Candidatus Eisenbacteria bacterium]|nr:sodium:calcium antiporter [Candidatus Eisenbacteria bacterium]
MNTTETQVGRNLFLLFLAVLATVPWIVAKYAGLHLDPGWEVALSGLAIIGAAFLISWAAEVAQFDVPRSVAMAAVALIAVLPEYAVDIYLAWRAGDSPSYIPLVSANMTGGNRLLVGVGWSLTAVLAWWSLRPGNKRSSGHAHAHGARSDYRERRITLEDELSIEFCFLAIPTVYCFTLWIKSTISLWDTAFLVLTYCAYIWTTLKGPLREPEVEGPAKILSGLRRRFRVSATLILFLFAAFVIVIATKPFAEGLIAVGKRMGIDEFLLIQWIAPLASESPEIIVVAYFAARGFGTAAMTAIISSKINQWTLLVSSLPIAFSLSQGKMGHIPLDPRPREEVLLTACQSFFALAVIADLTISLWEALVLFALFATQLFFPTLEARYFYSAVYVVLGLIVLTKKGPALRKNFSYLMRYLK